MKKILLLLSLLSFAFISFISYHAGNPFRRTAWSICCAASSVDTVLSDRHTDVSHAKTIRRNRSYLTSIPSHSCHYYCLPGQETRSRIRIRIRSEQKLSLSFQLYDADGNVCTPATYALSPAKGVLTIDYPMPAGESRLLALYNSKDTALNYTISYQDISSGNASKPASTPSTKPARSAKKPARKNRSGKSAAAGTGQTNTSAGNTDTGKTTEHTTRHTTPKQKRTSGSRKTSAGSTQQNISAAKKRVHSKPSPKPAQKTPNQTSISAHITLSQTFLRASAGQTVRLKATVRSANRKSTSWNISPASRIKNKQITRAGNNETLTFLPLEKGIYTITCRLKKTQNISASCTVKIS